MKSKGNLRIIAFMCALVLLFNFMNIRICIFYNLFKIPCVGCGLTRSIKELLKLHIMDSIKYNILGIPIFIGIVTYIVLSFLNKTKDVNKVMNKYKVSLICISVILMIITWYINIHNPILYV